ALAAAPPAPAPGPVAGAPLTVAVVGGDADQEAGFRAYVDLLNAGGGIAGRPVRSAPAPLAGAIATVNLGAEAIGPTVRPSGPVLETLAAPEAVLGGDVLGLAGPPERQARLAVDEVFPAPSPGATAVLVTATRGIFATTVADAFESGLRSRGVSVTRAAFTTGQPTNLPPGAAVFVSLGPAEARAWVATTRPARSVTGIYSLYDPSLVTQLPDGSRLVSPYRAPGGAEADAIRTGSRRDLGAGVLHGWATAKALAVALWRSGADEPAEVTAALVGLAGYDSGLAPPYEVRPGTRSRTPEGLVLAVASGAFVPRSDFRRDTT
ncbi:MAG: hypothetical protein ACRD1K_02085, partial [Acidimicrobiales bacterium]